MGEETASVDAARIALARIAAGQSDIALIGSAYNGERLDLLMLYEFGGYNLKDKFAPVWARHDTPGFALGSAGAFLVIEFQGSCAGTRRQALRQTDQCGCRSGATQATRRGNAIAGSSSGTSLVSAMAMAR